MKQLERIDSDLFSSFDPDDEVFVGGVSVSGSVSASFTGNSGGSDVSGDIGGDLQ